MTDLPPLPKIEGDFDLYLDVFTHKSIKPPGQGPNEEYGDTDRLAEIGRTLLELSVTNHFYSKRPMLTAAQIADNTRERLSDGNILFWLDAYRLKDRYRYLPDERQLIETPAEMRHFFHTYIGALYIRSGMKVVQDWISHLIDPEEDPPAPAFAYEPPLHDSQMPPPPTTNPPPLPSGQPPPGYTPPGHSGAGPSLANITLALVNQTAAQRHIQVTYSAEQTGPPHLPTWTVRCFMNGVEQGRGTGKSQKHAKEEAARQAWVRMGW